MSYKSRIEANNSKLEELIGKAEELPEAGGGDASTADAIIDRSIKEISSNAEKIGDSAFNKCSALTSAIFPNATSIANYAFNGCNKLTSIECPNATSIGSSAFYKCSALTSIECPNATSIGSSAFYKCSALTSIEFPNATSIANYAFNGCNKLTSIEFPNATSIGDSAFYGCSALTSVEFPNATSIGVSAFYKCSALTSIEIPNATSIGTNAFNGCTACLTYDFSGCKAIPTLKSTAAFSGINAEAKILVPGALYNEWIAATNWATYADYIVAVGEVPVEYSEGLEFNIYYEEAELFGIGTCTDSVIRIPPEYQGYPVTNIAGGLDNVDAMEHLIIPDTVKAIQSTCSYNKNLQEVTFGSGLESINYWAFDNNTQCKKYDFSRCTKVPTLNYYSEPGYGFLNMPDDCQIIVPASLYNQWISDTNWTYYADHIVAAG